MQARYSKKFCGVCGKELHRLAITQYCREHKPKQVRAHKKLPPHTPYLTVEKIELIRRTLAQVQPY